MSGEYIHVVEGPAKPEQVLAKQQQEPLPEEAADLEGLAAHLAQYQNAQLLLRVADILAEETGQTPQVRQVDGGAIELTGESFFPERWRIDGQAATIEQRQPDGEYRPVERSWFFPMLAAVNLVQLLFPCDRAGEETLKSFREWVRKKTGRRDEDEPSS